SWWRVYKKETSLSIGNGGARVGTLRRLSRRDIRAIRISNLRETREVCYAIRDFAHAAGAFRETAENVGRDRRSTGNRRPSGEQCQRRAGIPTEDCTQLPSLDEPRDDAVAAAEQFLLRPKRQLPCSVAANIVRAVVDQRFVFAPVSR